MLFRDIVEAVTDHFYWALSHGVRPDAQHILGRPGSGKNHMIEKDIPRVMRKLLNLDNPNRFGLLRFTMTSTQPEDINGLPMPVRITHDGREVVVTEYARSAYIPLELPEYGIIFLDEVGQAQFETQLASGNLRQEGAIGMQSLPITWMIMGASNFLEDRAGVIAAPSNVDNKECKYRLDYDEQSHKAAMLREGIDPIIISWVMNMGSDAIAQAVPKEAGMSYSTPRSISMVDRMLKSRTWKGPELGAWLSDFSTGRAAILMEQAKGIIGEHAAASMFTHFKMANDLPAWSALVRDPEGVEIIEVERGTSRIIRPDIAEVLSHMIVQKTTAETIAPVMRFVDKRMIPELKTATLMELNKQRAGELMLCPEFAEWIDENADLVVNSIL